MANCAYVKGANGKEAQNCVSKFNKRCKYPQNMNLLEKFINFLIGKQTICSMFAGAASEHSYATEPERTHARGPD